MEVSCWRCSFRGTLRAFGDVFATDNNKACWNLITSSTRSKCFSFSTPDALISRQLGGFIVIKNSDWSSRFCERILWSAPSHVHLIKGQFPRLTLKLVAIVVCQVKRDRIIAFHHRAAFKSFRSYETAATLKLFGFQSQELCIRQKCHWLISIVATGDELLMKDFSDKLQNLKSNIKHNPKIFVNCSHDEVSVSILLFPNTWYNCHHLFAIETLVI